MKKKIIIRVTVLVCLIILAIVIFIMRKTPTPAPVETSKNCIATYNISNNDEIAWGLTIYQVREQKTFEAAPLSAGLIGVNAWTNEVIVNDKYFSTLVKTKAIGVTEPEIIWTYKELSFTEHKPKEIVEFLLKSQLITTYVHLESHLCLVNESDTETAYKADFDATHSYCTNSCTTQPYAFSIEINKQNGIITLLP